MDTFGENQLDLFFFSLIHSKPKKVMGSLPYKQLNKVNSDSNKELESLKIFLWVKTTACYCNYGRPDYSLDSYENMTEKKAKVNCKLLHK